MKNTIQFMMLCILVIGGFSFGTTYARLPHQPQEKTELVQAINIKPTAILIYEIEKQSPIVHQSNAHELDVARQSPIFTSVILCNRFARSQTQDKEHNYKVSDRPLYGQNSTNTIHERYSKARQLSVVTPYNIFTDVATENAPNFVGKPRYLDVATPYNICTDNVLNISENWRVSQLNLWAELPNI